MKSFFLNQGAITELKFIIGLWRVVRIARSCVSSSGCVSRSLVNVYRPTLASRQIPAYGCCLLTTLSAQIDVFRN